MSRRKWGVKIDKVARVIIWIMHKSYGKRHDYLGMWLD